MIGQINLMFAVSEMMSKDSFDALSLTAALIADIAES